MPPASPKPPALRALSDVRRAQPASFNPVPHRSPSASLMAAALPAPETLLRAPYAGDGSDGDIGTEGVPDGDVGHEKRRRKAKGAGNRGVNWRKVTERVTGSGDCCVAMGR